MCVDRGVRLPPLSPPLRVLACRIVVAAAPLILAASLAGLWAIGAWADGAEPPSEPPPPATVETPNQPALTADDSPMPTSIPSAGPDAATPSSPETSVQSPDSLPATLPIGSAAGAGDPSSIAGLSSGNPDGVLVPAPPQVDRGYDPAFDGPRLGPDPTDLILTS